MGSYTFWAKNVKREPCPNILEREKYGALASRANGELPIHETAFASHFAPIISWAVYRILNALRANLPEVDEARTNRSPALVRAKSNAVLGATQR